MANLLVEIGNTALKAAWSEGTTLGKTFRYQGEKVMEFILSLTEREKPEVLCVASARVLTEPQEAALSAECRHLIILDSGHTTALLGYSLPEFLSFDRAASLLAARFLFRGKPCSVFDFGTTLTVDFLDTEGRYRGGNISPGCRTRFMSLNRYTKSLPVVDTPVDIPREGTSVQTAIEAGVISGIMFEIEGYMRQYPDHIVVFTGGDAAYFAGKMSHSVFVVANMVLMGLAIMTDDYVKKYIQ